ncbi:MAG: methyltransferase [Chryseolinea sp.]
MKSRAHFQFQQFTVADDQCSMKVGTDAVLLAAWVSMRDAKHVLDIGTGSGVMALIAAQRTSAECLVCGVEIQPKDCAQAAANVAASPWSKRVQIICSAVQDHQPGYRYDVIICNPPYFINSLRSPETGRNTARHSITLDHNSIVDAVNRLMSESGTANFVMPPDEGNQLRAAMETAGMQLQRFCRFRTRAGKKVERVLMSFGRTLSENPEGVSDPAQVHSIDEEEILLYEHGGDWSAKYSELTHDLYLPRTPSFPKSL